VRDEVTTYGWTPWEFLTSGLLRFCFTEDDVAQTQVSFVEERVRTQLVRHAYPLQGEPGAVCLTDDPGRAPQLFDRAVAAAERRDPQPEFVGEAIRNFADLVDVLTTRVVDQQDPQWTAGVARGTELAFIRRLGAMSKRLGQLVTLGVTRPDPSRSSVNVVDINRLHESAQRFVVGALLSETFEAKQAEGRQPLRFVVLDELNKYAPREGRGPLRELLTDVAERGRSLGVLLIGAQQAASAVDPAILRNAAVKVVGRLDAGEAGEYRFLTPELRERATRFLPGTMVLDQPLIPAPLPVRFPFPPFATNASEARPDPAEVAGRREATWAKLGA